MHSRSLLLALTLTATAFAQGSSCGQLGVCECLTCTSAIDLAVFDADGEPLASGWTLEATLDGAAIDVSSCDADLRFENVCSFGSQSGIYRMAVRGTGFATRELAARVAAKSGEDCCNNACVSSTAVDAFLVTDEAQ